VSVIPERSPDAERPARDERHPEALLLTLVAIAETVTLTCNSPKTRTAAALSALLARYFLELGPRRWLRPRSGCRRVLEPARPSRPPHPEATQPSVRPSSADSESFPAGG
jgi:hypothetical protein